MPNSFTIRNTGDAPLDVEKKGQGAAGRSELGPGEERTYTVDKNSHVQVREAEEPDAEPKAPGRRPV
jgi:hypothetical protein